MFTFIDPICAYLALDLLVGCLQLLIPDERQFLADLDHAKKPILGTLFIPHNTNSRSG